EPADKSNRLTKTTVGNGINFPEAYSYNVHGCLTAIDTLKLACDFNDQLKKVDLVGGGKAFYVYDVGGQRVRRVIETLNGKRKLERIYIGGFEVYREFDADGTQVTLARESLSVMDDTRRIAIADTETRNSGSPISNPESVIRYQLSNHLGSATVELDRDGA